MDTWSIIRDSIWAPGLAEPYVGADHSCSTPVTLQLTSLRGLATWLFIVGFSGCPLPLPSAPGVGDQVAKTQQTQHWDLGSALNLQALPPSPAPRSSLAPSMISLTPNHYFHEQLSFGHKPKATHVFRCPLCNVANLWLCIMYPGHRGIS